MRGHAVGGPDWLGGYDWLDGEAERAGKRRDGSDWLNGGAEGAAEMRSGSQAVNNFSESTPPCRSLKGFRVRRDYQRRYDVLAAMVKHARGKEELIGKALGIRKALPASCFLLPNLLLGKGNRRHKPETWFTRRRPEKAGATYASPLHPPGPLVKGERGPEE